MKIVSFILFFTLVLHNWKSGSYEIVENARQREILKSGHERVHWRHGASWEVECTYAIDTFVGSTSQSQQQNSSAKWVIKKSSEISSFFNLFLFKGEKRFLAEDENVIQARIDSLMNLFLTNNSESVSQMIFNALETYKKFLVCESPMQNKISGPTLELLIKSLLIITCHRKDYDHLKSLVRWKKIFQIFKSFLTFLLLCFRSNSSHSTAKFNLSSTKQTLSPPSST